MLPNSETPGRADCGGLRVVNDISVAWNNALEVPQESALERVSEARVIRHSDPADDPAGPEVLPHAVRAEEHSCDPRWRTLDVEAQVSDNQCPGRPMEEQHFAKAKAGDEQALDLTLPLRRWRVGERAVKRNRLPLPRRAGCAEELSGGIRLRSLRRELPVRVRDHNEADWAHSVDLFSKLRGNGDRRMEDQLAAGESDHRHANRDLYQPGLPTKLVLGTPEIRVVLN